MARVPLPPAEQMKLTVLAEIASGGMGSVEMARVEDGRLAGQVLAIKRLHASIANDKTFVDMFLDEAWLTAAMNSPHVMGVVAHGTDERGMFLAVELIQGVPLSRLVKEARIRKEQFSEQVVACICMQICEGLLEAHNLKGTDGKPLSIVHRDLTPGNVLVAFDGNVKIVDFGIAKAEERITHTRTGTMKGKPAYMAPEQAKGSKNTDLRADLFSLGVMMFELLASRRPWTDKSAFDLIMAAALKPHPNIAELRPGVSPVFAELIDRCLAKKPVERWNSAAEIRDRLMEWRRAQKFPKPDLDMLREFVERCAQAQIEWFRRALAGDFAKGDAQTFKELEEAIDDARKRSGEMPPSSAMLSSGRAAFAAMTPSHARSATDPPITPRPPSSGSAIPSQPSSNQPLPPTQPSLSEASRQAQRRGPPQATQPFPQAVQGGNLGATIALSDADLQIGGGTFGPGASPSKGLGGTEYMAVSPLKGMKIPDPHVESDSSSDLAATRRLPELSDRPIAGALSPSVIRPSTGRHGAIDEDPLGATMRSDEEAHVRSSGRPLPGAGDMRSQSTRPGAEAPPQKGLSAATVILLILVAFIAGGAIAAWVAKTYLMKAGALDMGPGSATTSVVYSAYSYSADRPAAAPVQS